MGNKRVIEYSEDALQRRVLELQEANKRLEVENQELREKHDAYVEGVSHALDLANEVVAYANAVKTGEAVMLSRPKIHKPDCFYEDKIDRWKGPRDYFDPLEKRIRIAERKAQTAEARALGAEIRGIIYHNPNAKRVPVIYYDFFTKRGEFGVAAKSLLGIEQSDGGLTLERLLRKYIQREYIRDRDKPIDLLSALKKGEPLNNYEAWTVATKKKEPRQLSISTLPIMYRDVVKRNRRPIGTLIFLRSAPKHIGKRHYEAFISHLKGTIDEVCENFMKLDEEICQEMSE